MTLCEGYQCPLKREGQYWCPRWDRYQPRRGLLVYRCLNRSGLRSRILRLLELWRAPG